MELLAHTLDELIGLALRVDHERPSPALLDNDSILDGVLILGQPDDSPLLDGNWLAHELHQVGPLLYFYSFALDMGQPLRMEFASEVGSEDSTIGDHC